MTGLVYPGLLVLAVAGVLGFGQAFLLKNSHKLTRASMALGSLGMTVFAGSVALSYAGIVDVLEAGQTSSTFGSEPLTTYGFGGLPMAVYEVPVWVTYGLWAAALLLLLVRGVSVALVERPPRRLRNRQKRPVGYRPGDIKPEASTRAAS